MNDLKPFIDPWDAIPEKDKRRTTMVVSNSAIADINSVYTKKGVLQTTVAILLEKLRQQLKFHGLICYDPERYIEAVTDCEIILGGTKRDAAPVITAVPVPDVPNQAPQRNDRPRTKRVARKAKGVTEPANSEKLPQHPINQVAQGK